MFGEELRALTGADTVIRKYEPLPDEAEESKDSEEDEAEEEYEESEEESEEEEPEEADEDEAEEDFDYDDEFDDEDDDLRPIETLDQIIDREGIDLSYGDPRENVLILYNAGLSIIEISKVLKMGVSDVKYIIDSNSAN